MPKTAHDNEHPSVSRMLDYSVLYAWGLIGSFLLVAVPMMAWNGVLRGGLAALYALGCIVCFDHGRREAGQTTFLFGTSRAAILTSGGLAKSLLSALMFALAVQVSLWFHGVLAFGLAVGGVYGALGIMAWHYRGLDRPDR